MKTCTNCKKTKNLDEFNNKKNGKFGKEAVCSDCRKEYQREYRKNNKEKIKKGQKRYEEKNKIKISEKKKKYRQKNKEKMLERGRNYRENNRDKTREYYLNNREREIARQRKYRRENKEKININLRKKRKLNMEHRIKCNLRTRIWEAIKGNNKSQSTIDLLGCSISLLKEHLAVRFKDNMNWDNYGEWHIDHIRPCSSFDLSDPSQQQKCFHYTNLQPLWAKDNLSKGSKY